MVTRWYVARHHEYLSTRLPRNLSPPREWLPSNHITCTRQMFLLPPGVTENNPFPIRACARGMVVNKRSQSWFTINRWECGILFLFLSLFYFSIFARFELKWVETCRKPLRPHKPSLKLISRTEQTFGILNRLMRCVFFVIIGEN
jgi:hypothetical protein